MSTRGWLLVSLLGLVGAYSAVLNVHRFLAVTHRVNTDVMVVEGWVSQNSIRVSADEFKARSYRQAFTTGGPVEGSGGYTNDYNTVASVEAGRLKAAGVPDESVQMVPSRVIGRDRTYSSAIALRNWFRDHDTPVHSINVVTEDAHARRTRLLFQEALGNDVKVGVISIPNPDYDARHWWRYSEGVREVVGESVAYIYAKVFFYPPKLPHDKETPISQVTAATGK